VVAEILRLYRFIPDPAQALETGVHGQHDIALAQVLHREFTCDGFEG